MMKAIEQIPNEERVALQAKIEAMATWLADWEKLCGVRVNQFERGYDFKGECAVQALLADE